MIKQHSLFEKVIDETVLWQYMSLTKFLFLIKNGKLHLHRIDDLMDKEEGVLSILDKKSLPFYEDTKEWKDYLDDDRKRTFVSCWIKSPIEQSLMWYAYGKDGVAIRTTAGAIRRAMEIDEKHQINMIEVRYIDKEKQAAHTPEARINWYHFYTTKRKFFEMEKEVRLIFHDDDRKYKEKGIDVDVLIDELIEEIKVSSSLPDYVYKLLCQEVKNVGLNILPVKSEL